MLVPGTGLVREGKKGAGLFFLLSTIFFLSVLIWRFPLVAVTFNSLGAGLILFILSPSEFFSVFTTDMLEFWIAGLFLAGTLSCLWWLSLRTLKKTVAEKNTGPKEDLSFSAAGWKSFKKHTIALYASVVVFALYSIAFLSPYLSPFNPYDQQDFLVTAYKPPVTTVDALVLKSPRGISIPLRDESTLAGRLTNIMIGDLQRMRHRNEQHNIVFVDTWVFDMANQIVTYRQGKREKTISATDLVLDSQGHPETISRTFILGTDQYGRDIISRIIYGSRISLSIGFLVVLISVTLGTVIGVTSGYFGGLIDGFLMRIVDVLIAFPALFLILIIIATFGNSIFLIVITLSFTGWMGVSRLVRSQVLSLKEQEFILAARSLGLSDIRIIFRHLVPNTLTPVIVAATLRIGSIILTEAGLSFLGLGVQPPTPSWGNIINEGRDNLLNHWWISTFPGIAILSTVICFNLIGDGVRDALDPRMRA
ncbi:ABC transporter permease [Prosthecochloris sp. HL-130-GSB]|jgi:peptide/nickel transport system permease protein|uniref:ABC transporter permease n=1 Tax=Prosthecochloris sp. HL-130-GSB TaxID=1974213 RepID=UPI000A1C05FC|nr:ABC transporter permease [Prosthecochloris sp. HL-130-GSB]ARM30677.1 ABC transporter permease [Prosthecochloris sp. HL-130-GSB]